MICTLNSVLYLSLHYAFHIRKKMFTLYYCYFIAVGKEVNSSFVQCIMCKELFKYEGKLGTSTLRRHNCSKNQVVSRLQAKITSYATSSKSIPINEKQKITRITVEAICKDLLSFDSFSGEGFLNLGQCLVEIG